MKTISVKIPEDLDLKLTAVAEKRRESKSALIRDALDHLVSNGVESADIERLVPNPEKKDNRKELRKLKGDLEKLKEEYGDKAIQNDQTLCPTMRGFNIAHHGDKKKIVGLEKEIEKSEININ